MARPTKSQTLYIQMMGRGTRPVCDINFDSVLERSIAIEGSIKPGMTVIDFVDNTKENDLITSPRLIGLKPKFNPKGKRLFGEVEKKLKEHEIKNPTRPVREASDFEEMDIIAERIDIWDIEADRESIIREISPFRWIQVEEDVYHLNVPIKPHNYILRLTGDTLDQWRISKIYPAKIVKTKKGNVWHKEKVIEGKDKIKGLEEAVKKCDQWVRKKAPTCLNLMYHSPGWGKSPATAKQINKLKNEFGIQIPDGMKLSKGDAAKLIDACIQQKRSEKYVAKLQREGSEEAPQKES